MFETFRDNGLAAKGSKQKQVPLFLEELEGRCLLSSGLGPLGGITTGPDGEIWFLEKDRLGRLDPTTGLIQEFAQGINTGPENFVGSSIAEAPDGTIWFLSNNQLTRFTPNSNALNTFNLLPDRVPLDSMQSIAVGADGIVWVLEKQPDAYGIARLDPTTGDVQNFAVGQLQPYGMSMPPSAIGFAPDGKIWIAIWMSALHEMDPATGVVDEVSLDKNASDPAPALSSSTNGVIKDALPISSSNALAVEIDRQPGFAVDITPPVVITPIGNPDPVRSPELASFVPPADLWSYYSYPVPPKIAPDGSYWDLTSVGGPYGPPGTGAIREYNTSTSKSQLFPVLDGAVIQMTPGPDGNIWFTGGNWNGGNPSYEIGELNPNTGTIAYFLQATPSPLPSTPNSSPATGTTVSALAGINFEGVVATFTPQTPIPITGVAYQATIDWGDGTTSSLVLTVTDNSTYDVTAGHTYQSAGTYNIKVTIGNYNPANPLGDNAVTVFSRANVNDPFVMNM